MDSEKAAQRNLGLKMQDGVPSQGVSSLPASNTQPDFCPQPRKGSERPRCPCWSVPASEGRSRRRTRNAWPPDGRTGAVSHVPHPRRRAPFRTAAPVPGGSWGHVSGGPPRERHGLVPGFSRVMCVFPGLPPLGAHRLCQLGIWACGATIVSHRLNLGLTLVTFLSLAQTSWQSKAVPQAVMSLFPTVCPVPYGGTCSCKWG